MIRSFPKVVRLTGHRNSPQGTSSMTETANRTSFDVSMSIDGRQICIDGGTHDKTCSQSQLTLTLAVLTSQLLGVSMAIVYPLVARSVAGWVSATSHLLMTLSIAATLALSAQASTLALLRRHLLGENADDMCALHVLMAIMSTTMWLSLWLFHSWVDPNHKVSTSEEKRSKS